MLGVAVVIVGFYAFIINATSWATQAMSGVPDAEVQAVVDGVLAFAEDNGGAGPGHAIGLVTGEQLDEYDFVTANSLTDLSGVPIGALTLEEFAAADVSERETAAAACEAGLPAETTAHRLGDFVFTYHGMDLGAVDGDLWVVVGWDDPDLNVGNGAMRTTTGPGWTATTTNNRGGWVWVGLASGEVRSILTSLFDNELSLQNDLRAEHDLAELPHPGEVTHDKPAVDGEGGGGVFIFALRMIL